MKISENSVNSENFIINRLINVSNDPRWNLPLFLLGLPDRSSPRLHSAFPLQSGEEKGRRMVRKRHAAQRSESESRLIPTREVMHFFPPFCPVISAFFFYFYTYEFLLGLLESFFLLFQACFFFGVSDHTFCFFVLRRCPNLINFFSREKTRLLFRKSNVQRKVSTLQCCICDTVRIRQYCIVSPCSITLAPPP